MLKVRQFKTLLKTYLNQMDTEWFWFARYQGICYTLGSHSFHNDYGKDLQLHKFLCKKNSFRSHTQSQDLSYYSSLIDKTCWIPNNYTYTCDSLFANEKHRIENDNHFLETGDLEEICDSVQFFLWSWNWMYVFYAIQRQCSDPLKWHTSS